MVKASGQFPNAHAIAVRHSQANNTLKSAASGFMSRW
jgi:hypothetical protein